MSNASPAVEPSTKPQTPIVGLAERTREALAFCLLCAREPGNAREHEELPPPPIQVVEADVRALEPTELRRALDEILLSKRANRGLLALLDVGLLQVVFPEVTSLIGFGEGDSRHKDVWLHTLQVVIQSVPRLSVRWAALMHDIGKPSTRSFADDGTVHFLHHAEVGARMFERLSRRERLFQDAEREEIRFLIYHHQRAHQYDEGWTDSAARRFSKEIGDALDDLMALSRADMTTKRKEKKRRFLNQLKDLQTRIEEIRILDAKPKALPKGLGEALISELGLPPSKLIGDIRKELAAAVESGELPNNAEFDLYLQFVRDNPVRFKLP